MYALIVLLPLFAAVATGLFGRALGPRACEIITTAAVGFAALLSWVAFFRTGFGDFSATMPLFEWIVSGSLSTAWSIRVDTLTVVMLVVVNTVSFLVHLYSIGYMHHDPHRPRFFAYLSLFTFAMLALVTSDNLVQMFFGWEGVGLASYLLIGFWFEKESANNAAIKAFVVNRVGDFGFALGIFGVFYVFDTVQLDPIFSGAAAVAKSGDTALSFLGFALDGGQTLNLLCLLLFMGAMGKSAQFLLHTWLPDAMEGPTPVSALIHAATMVTAGVFMVARLSPLFEHAHTALVVVTLIGAITAFFAASVGLVQNDIKRVIAYSTCSQLGYMFVALGVGAYPVAIFHLFTHAFFKALLFLGAGSVIHAVENEQDMRQMGGLRRIIPYTYGAMLIGTLALTGFPLTAGFFSKDAIIEASFAAHGPVAEFAFFLLVAAACMTSFYSWRLVFMTFHGKPRMPADVLAHAHESPRVMLIPLAVLAIGAVFAGLLFSGAFIGEGYDGFWKTALYAGKDNHILHDLHEVPFAVKAAPFVMMLVGFALAYLLYIARPEWPRQIAKTHDGLYRFLLNKWYFDELYNFCFVRPAHWLGGVLWRVGDGRIIDGLGPDGVAARVLQLTAFARRLQTGYVYHYALAMLIGLALLATWSLFHTGGSF